MRVNKVLRSKLFFLIFIILSILAFHCTLPKSKNVEDSHPDQDIQLEKKRIRTTLIEMWDAIEKEDIKKYANFIHPNFTQFGETDTILTIGKENEVNGVWEWVQNSEDIHTEMANPRISINGNVAWITYFWSDHGVTYGEKFASHGKSTRIFVKENNKWLCIHGHYTLL